MLGFLLSLSYAVLHESTTKVFACYENHLRYSDSRILIYCLPAMSLECCLLSIVDFIAVVDSILVVDFVPIVEFLPVVNF